MHWPKIFVHGSEVFVRWQEIFVHGCIIYTWFGEIVYEQEIFVYGLDLLVNGLEALCMVQRHLCSG